MLRLENLTKSIEEGENKRVLFENVSLSFENQGLYVIEGRSGSGKSTFLHLLALMEKADSGKIFFLGKDLSKFSEKKRSEYRRDYLGFIFQNHHLEDALSASENVALPLLLRGEREKAALEKANKALSRFFSKDVKDKKASCLSGGEKARVSFLRATIKEPAILLCDEPTGALDKKNARFIMEELKEYSKNHLVLLVSHDKKLADEYADSILLLNDGKLFFNIGKKENKEKKSFLKKKRKRRNFPLLWFLFRKKGFKDVKKNLLSTATTFFLFSFLLLFVGFFEGGRSFLEDGEDRSLLYLNASFSASKKEELAGSRLSLARSYRPSRADAENVLGSFSSVKIKDDYSYFFPSSLPFRENGYLKDNVSFCPIWDLSLQNRTRSFLLEGEAPKGDSLDYALVNEELASSLKEPLGSLLEVSYETSFEYQGKKEMYAFSFRFEVVGIVKDFAFLSLPRLFYSYKAFEEKMREETLNNGKTLSEMFLKASGEEEWTSYSYLLFFEEEDAKGLKEFASSLKEPFAITNALWSSLEGFSALWKAMEGSLLPFLIIETVFAFFSIVLIAYSSFLEERRFLSLLDALGIPIAERVTYFENAVGGNIFLGLLLAFLVSFPLAKLCSFILEKKFGLSNLLLIPYYRFLGIPLLLPVLLLFFGVFLLLLGIRLPIFLLSRNSLSGELKDE